jgi:CRISPR/Cas system CSM-associated protein Csm4 (group 5 of RAMP superfamily)
MKEITSKKTKKVQIISEETYKQLIEHGFKDRYVIRDIPERKLSNKPVEIISTIKKQPPKTIKK